MTELSRHAQKRITILNINEIIQEMQNTTKIIQNLFFV